MHQAAASMFIGFSNDFPTGLTIPMWRIIAILYQKGEQRQVDIARLASIDESTMSRTIVALVRKAIVSKRRSKTSNREVSVSLTRRGRAIVDRHIPKVLEHEALITRGLSEGDVHRLRRYLIRMRENMEAFLAHPSAGKRHVRGSPVE
jgi:DNA-binding MarR family transcriptional regulator